MDPDTRLVLQALADARGGYFVRADLDALAIDPEVLGPWMRQRHVRRIRHGAYAVAASYDPLKEAEQYAVRCLAVADKLAPNAVLCGPSSLAVQGKPLVGADLSRVHVVRRDGQTGRDQAGVRHRRFAVSDEDLVEIDGRLMTSEVRAIWESGVCNSPRSSLVLMDHALLAETVTRDDLERVGDVFASWAGSRAPRTALALADGRAESAGESVTRWFFHVFDLPMPDLQFVVVDAYGEPIGRTDYAWHDHRLLGEFDGKIKYARGFVEGKDPDDIVMDEREREKQLCARRYGMIRFVWRDVWRPSVAEARRVRDELEASRRRFL
ncbi:hypothetical protein FE697_010490 [Mumia zhuanghuii]|uniref:Transcriptional regulator, AbiEi antitoxin, Type IV TA system n=2 Tax=Mumia TaxID=1546255 RepID=A0ABW1QHR8_9ACTN|nr:MULTISPECIES: hypothetical protein [Mumia]KAA1422611.1 hypothetical protein FE697_010490 [Mumia zhuanghuii]